MPGRIHGRSTRRPTTDFTRDIIGSNNIPFQLLNEIGHGGYGTVWRARNLHATHGDGIAAVKVLKKARLGSTRHAFHVREINHQKAVAGHPNIVNMWGVIQDKDNLYLVMDYCSGGTLLDLIVKERAFARNDAFVKGIFLQLIDAVHHCHEQGVFHRDIKPENILLNRERSNVFLTDFGLSTMTRDSQCFGTGSKNYMSPECLNGKIAGSYNCKRSDTWALGIILMNMIAGRSPWLLATPTDECFMSYLRDRDYLRKRFPISKAAAKIVRKILTPNPAYDMNLVDLRKLVEKVDTFFMSEKEVAKSNDTVQLVAHYLRPREEGMPIREAEDHNLPSEGLPIFVDLSTTSDDLHDSESTVESETPSQAEEIAPRALRVRNVVPLVDSDSVADEQLGWRRGAKTAAAQVAPVDPSPAGSTEESSSSQPDSLVTTSNSSGGFRSFFRVRKSGASNPAAASGPPEMSSRLVTFSRLAGQFKRILGVI
ncbi:hypothetical protein EUX98_g1642 [Antrodiella citrinella]|uniref:non-specific serine/threonine protein kinase n=1 Tax=Antrodiella citrinella TaxID=2447956 RepID=A0A4S4N3X2_9APHY|nr:hypothetical protein EUX98_g1642 [Antrodiella citrinella]